MAGKQGPEEIARILGSLALSEDQDALRAKASERGLEFADLSQVTPRPEAIALVAGSLARLHRVLPLAVHESTLWVAMADIDHNPAIADLTVATGLQVVPVLAVPTEVDRAIERHYPSA